MKMFQKWLSLLLAVIVAASLCGTAAAADPNFDVKDGIAVKYIGTATVITPEMFSDEGITTIGATCFKDTEVSEVTIPKTVKSLQASAFAECRKLATLTFEAGSPITAIPNNCFENATSLKTIQLPSGVTSIGQYAFRNCVSLKAVEGTSVVKTKYSDTYRPVTGNLTTVGTDAFANCPILVITCFKGSALETYAINNKVKYESLDPVIYSITPQNPPEYTMVNGNTLSISVTVAPDVAKDAELAWSSSDTSIAEVSEQGVVTPKKAGVITVTVASGMTIDGKPTAQTSVRVVVLDPNKRWQEWDGNWYYCSSSSEFATNWNEIGGKWYYFNSLGKMATGWLKLAPNWFYFNANGVMQTGWQKIDGEWYYFNASGLLQSGWLSEGGKWYYLDPQNGSAMVTGVKTIAGVTYLFRSNGMLTAPGWYKENGKWYYLNDQNAIHKGWVKDQGKWYYLSIDDGAMVTGWARIGGIWYYMNASGAMQTGWQKLNGGNWYYFSQSGAMQIGWLKLGKTWYYLKGDGAMATGWIQLNGNWFYLDASGAMATGTRVIDGVKYTFNKHGVWIK